MARPKKKKYQARKGAPLTNKDAQVVGERLESLAKKNNGEIVVDNVVDDARSRRSPLHKYFDWEDTSAAEKYRKFQARQLMGAVVEVVITKGTTKAQRSFFNVSNIKGKRVYVSIEVVKKSPDYIDQLVEEADKGLERLRETLQMLREEYRKSRKKR